MPASARSSILASLAHRARAGVVGSVSLATVVATGLALATPPPAASAASAASAAAAARPGLAGPAIVLGNHLALDEGSADIATDHSGTAYVGWISSSYSNTTLRRVHLCVLPPGARACKGGVQTIKSLGPPSAADLKVLIVQGTPTLIWFHDDVASESMTHGSELSEATVSTSGVLSPAVDVASAPSFGSLLDAEVGPGGNIWTIAYASGLPSQIEVREGITNDPVIVHTPYGVGYARLAFAHSTPIIGITKDGSISQPAAYSFLPGHAWKHFKNVKGTWAVGNDIGLVDTSSGVRLITQVGNASYYPVVAKWTGSGFSRRTLTGDRNSAAPSTEDVVTDASGRLVQVSNEDGQITVANFPDTIHASVFRFRSKGTITAPEPQISTTPRGHGWVVWGYEGSFTGDKLLVAPIRLADLHQHRTVHGSHGSVTVTGPASCLPADTISVGVAGHAAAGWRVGSRHLSLGGKTVHSSLDGAALKPGKHYLLKGSVTFTDGGSHETVKAAVKFRACPNP